MTRRIGLLSFALIFASCSDDPDTPDATLFPDAARDAGVTDRGSADAAPDATIDSGADAGPEDLGPGDTGVTDGGVVGILIPGITATISVHLDEHGIPHLSCRTTDDCFAGQGYMHASHRFGQMDLRRRFVRGKLSELFGLAGEQVMNIDRNSRSFIATRNGDRLEERMLGLANPETRSAISAYTRGVNAWIADLRAGRNGARVTDEWPVGPSLIADWEDLDSAACMLALLEDLTNESSFEIALGMMAAVMPPDLFSDLYGLRPASRSTILPNSADRVRFGPSPLDTAMAGVRPRLSEVHDLLLASLRGEDPESLSARGYGSNNWILRPSMSNNGKALLANDPHLGLENPPVWYVVSMDAVNDLHVAGVSFAGVPGVILGHNENIAWGATTTFFDQADVYVETLTSSASVFFNGNVVPMIEREFTFQNSALGPITETFYYVPHHGPVVSIDRANNRAISVRWAGHDADTDLNFLTGMPQARSVAEAQTVLRNLTATGQNFVVADVAGNIGWYPYSRVPNRPWAAQFPPFLPLPGTGEAEWQGFIPYDELPQATNPDQDYLATANNDMNGNLQDGDPLNDGQYLQHFVAPGYRHQRIVERIEAQRGMHNLATMQEIQADVHSEIGEELTPEILGLATQGLDAAGQLVATALMNWDFECPTGLTETSTDSAPIRDRDVTASSAGCMAFHAVLPRLNRLAFDDEIAAAGVSRRADIDALVLLLSRPGDLRRGAAYWDNVSTSGVETATTAVVAAMNAAGAYLVGQFGGQIEDWRWGRKHTVSIGAAFSSAVNLGPFANDGGLFTVDVANPRNLYNDDYSHSSGPSMRLACELNQADGVDCTIELPGGQETFTDSPHFSDLLEKWLQNQPYSIWFDAGEVEAASQRVIEISPRP